MLEEGTRMGGQESPSPVFAQGASQCVRIDLPQARLRALPDPPRRAGDRPHPRVQAAWGAGLASTSRGVTARP